jgi:hypothetical protein
VPGREHGLDWLRVFAFLVLIFYHSGMIYVSWPFHIKNAETSVTLEHFMLFFNRWRLPLLFFISGAGVAFSLRRRTLAMFAGERFVRLFIPVVFGMLVVIPPQIYFERLHRSEFSGSYASFYPSVFEFVSYPQGSLSWHHLWFVVYIFFYSLAALPFFAFIRSARGARLPGALAAGFEKHPWTIYLINVPNLFVSFTLGPRWPVTHDLVSDWANLTGSLLTFLWGFVFASDARLLDHVTRRRREFLTGAILFNVIFFYVHFTRIDRTWPAEVSGGIGTIISAYLGMLSIFALIGYARTLITRPSPGLTYATEVVYPFYIVHQTVTIAAGYYILQWPLPVFAKLALTALATLIGSLAIVEVIRRTPPLRPLFGLRLSK